MRLSPQNLGFARGDTMTARLRSWWQKLKHHSFFATIIIIVLVALIAFIFAAYRFGWSRTGFLNKTLWDWLQLLIIPLGLAIGGFVLSQVQKNTEQMITVDNQRETAL